MFACLCRDLVELAFQWAPAMQRKTHARDQDELERFWRLAWCRITGSEARNVDVS